MSSSSSETRQDQSGDVFNAPLIGSGGGLYKTDNKLYYVVGGVVALFIILKLVGKR